MDDCADKSMIQRYIGSMVADVHRTICLGGVFLYPNTIKNPDGKLRMLYECNPLSFVIEQAGGTSINENGSRIMEIDIVDLHQRSSIIIGSHQNVDSVRKYL